MSWTAGIRHDLASPNDVYVLDLWRDGCEVTLRAQIQIRRGAENTSDEQIRTLVRALNYLDAQVLPCPIP